MDLQQIACKIEVTFSKEIEDKDLKVKDHHEDNRKISMEEDPTSLLEKGETEMEMQTEM